MTDVVVEPASALQVQSDDMEDKLKRLLGYKDIPVYVVGENLSVLRHVFEKLSLNIRRTCSLLQFGRRHLPDDATAMLQAIKRDEPLLLWIQWHPEARTPRSRPNIRTAVEFLSVSSKFN